MATPRQFRHHRDLWTRFLGHTPDEDAETESERQLARRRFLRAKQGGAGFVIFLGLAALVSVL